MTPGPGIEPGPHWERKEALTYDITYDIRTEQFTV